MLLCICVKCKNYSELLDASIWEVFPTSPNMGQLDLTGRLQSVTFAVWMMHVKNHSHVMTSPVHKHTLDESRLPNLGAKQEFSGQCVIARGWLIIPDGLSCLSPILQFCLLFILYVKFLSLLNGECTCSNSLGFLRRQCGLWNSMRSRF